MMRPILSYALISLILLSQVGVPLHMHYCKGALESISLFVAKACEDHDIPVNLPACCKKALAKHCDSNAGKKCCDDEVMILKQNITSVTPSFLKWTDVPVYTQTTISEFVPFNTVGQLKPIEANGSDSGPPIYLMHQALIFYA
ncbi:MAG: hypothetical protein ABJC12_06275 [Saprospiraceae bacterium]